MKKIFTVMRYDYDWKSGVSLQFGNYRNAIRFNNLKQGHSSFRKICKAKRLLNSWLKTIRLDRHNSIRKFSGYTPPVYGEKLLFSDLKRIKQYAKNNSTTLNYYVRRNVRSRLK